MIVFFFSAAVALTSSNALLEHEYLFSTDSQPLISTPCNGLMRPHVTAPKSVIKGNNNMCLKVAVDLM